MTNEIIIGLGGLILSALTYFAGIKRAEKLNSIKEKENRIRGVFEKYMQFRQTRYTGGYDGLQKAGIATLKSNEEIKELINLIIDHGELNPMGRDNEEFFKDVNLMVFFKYAATNAINFHMTPIEEIVNQSGAKV